MSFVKLQAPIKKINEIIENKKFDGEVINFEVLKFLGIFVLRNAFSMNTIDSYRDRYFSDKEANLITKTLYHSTEVKLNKTHPFNNIIQEPEFIEIVSGFFNGNVGSDYIRILKKDQTDFKPVILHQDICYQIGGFERYSLIYFFNSM